MAILHFFCDESGKYRDHGVITVAGVTASSSRLAEFDDEWRTLLRINGLDALHMKHASRIDNPCGKKMPVVFTIEERITGLLPFADCINKHLEHGLMQAWSVDGYCALPMEAKQGLGGSELDPYYVAFMRGVQEIVKFMLKDDRLSVICDDDLATAWNAYLHCRRMQEVHKEVGDKVVCISFADDEQFPALQAADMAAFLTRQEAQARFFGENNEWARLYQYLGSGPNKESKDQSMEWWEMFADEKTLLNLANSLLALKANH